MFAIEFVGQPCIEFNQPAIRGRITLGDFSEEFVAPLVFWTVDDYQKQWREAAERIVAGEARSCFAASIRESPDDGAIFIWTAYKLADTVHFQHKLLLPETVKGTFEPLNIYAQVDERQTKTEDGFQISEWQVTVKDVAYWLRVG
ncbi:hypothetical protein [Aliterella atlantica]|uniref:CdiI C-terminal domain-containing protein n=1 Tax=Aliterella atlantica CENA595 TaxID=1618023 RepID=A0A0D8ZUF8_9CYAN|nr:hypothetical protein [Aliterella atlantica]KJH72403.1 hypothetical protein UH38_06395 [Aliterella atlantica CENA595]